MACAAGAVNSAPTPAPLALAFILSTYTHCALCYEALEADPLAPGRAPFPTCFFYSYCSAGCSHLGRRELSWTHVELRWVTVCDSPLYYLVARISPRAAWCRCTCRWALCKHHPAFTRFPSPLLVDRTLDCVHPVWKLRHSVRRLYVVDVTVAFYVRTCTTLPCLSHKWTCNVNPTDTGTNSDLTTARAGAVIAFLASISTMISLGAQIRRGYVTLFGAVTSSSTHSRVQRSAVARRCCRADVL